MFTDVGVHIGLGLSLRCQVQAGNICEQVTPINSGECQLTPALLLQKEGVGRNIPHWCAHPNQRAAGLRSFVALRDCRSHSSPKTNIVQTKYLCELRCGPEPTSLLPLGCCLLARFSL